MNPFPIYLVIILNLNFLKARCDLQTLPGLRYFLKAKILQNTCTLNLEGALEYCTQSDTENDIPSKTSTMNENDVTPKTSYKSGKFLYEKNKLYLLFTEDYVSDLKNI